MNTLSIADIRIGGRFRKDLGDLTKLKASMTELGMLQPVGVTPDNALVFGERRLTAAKELGWETVPVRVLDSLSDAAAAIKAERDENDCRKPMTASEMVGLGKALEQIEREAAEKRSKMGVSTNPPEPVPGGSPAQVGDTRDRVGAALGVSGKHYEQAKSVVENAPELVEAMDSGALPVATAAKVAKLPEKERKKVAKAADPKKAAKNALAKEAVAQAHEEATGEADVDPATAFVSDVEALCRDMDQIAARAKSLKDSPLSYTMHVDSAVAQIQAARQTLWQGRPAYSCPYCKGEGCDVCKRTGRVKKTTHDSGTKAMEGQS